MEKVREIEWWGEGGREGGRGAEGLEERCALERGREMCVEGY